jgi:hypothetical protein
LSIVTLGKWTHTRTKINTQTNSQNDPTAKD